MISILFEPRDLWVGVYWDVKRQRAWIKHVCGIPVPCRVDVFELYVCVMPCFPVVFSLPLWSTRSRYPKEESCS